MDKPNYDYDKRRFETFFDAVVAIILTILVLELKVPETEHSKDLSTVQQFRNLVPSFISYTGSFLLIVGIWIDHHILCLNLHKITKRYILLNMLFILTLSVVPFTTAFAGTNHHDSFAVALLFINYSVMNFIFSTLYWYSRVKGILSDQFWADNKKTGTYSMIGIFVLLAAIPLAFVNTYISFSL